MKPERLGVDDGRALDGDGGRQVGRQARDDRGELVCVAAPERGRHDSGVGDDVEPQGVAEGRRALGVALEGDAGHDAGGREPDVGVAVLHDPDRRGHLAAGTARGDVAADAPERRRVVGSGAAGPRAGRRPAGRDVAGTPHGPVEGVEGGQPDRRPLGQALDLEQGPVEQLGRVGLGVPAEPGQRARVLAHVERRFQRGPPDGAVGVVGTRQVRPDEQATDDGHRQQRRHGRDPGAPTTTVLKGGPAATRAQRRPADGHQGEDRALEGHRRRGQRAEGDAEAEQDERDEQRGIRPAPRTSDGVGRGGADQPEEERQRHQWSARVDRRQ